MTPLLTEKEQAYLRHVAQENGNASALSLHKATTASDHRAQLIRSLLGIYATMDRLKERGLVTTRLEAGGEVRGSQYKRFWTITEEGRKLL